MLPPSILKIRLPSSRLPISYALILNPNYKTQVLERLMDYDPYSILFTIQTCPPIVFQNHFFSWLQWISCLLHLWPLSTLIFGRIFLLFLDFLLEDTPLASWVPLIHHFLRLCLCLFFYFPGFFPHFPHSPWPLLYSPSFPVGLTNPGFWPPNSKQVTLKFLSLAWTSYYFFRSLCSTTYWTSPLDDSQRSQIQCTQTSASSKTCLDSHQKTLHQFPFMLRSLVFPYLPWLEHHLVKFLSP